MARKTPIDKALNGEFSLTAKGDCLLDYCKLKLSGDYTDEDYIEAYENTIKALTLRFNYTSDRRITEEGMTAVLVDLLSRNG